MCYRHFLVFKGYFVDVFELVMDKTGVDDVWDVNMCLRVNLSGNFDRNWLIFYVIGVEKCVSVNWVEFYDNFMNFLCNLIVFFDNWCE